MKSSNLSTVLIFKGGEHILTVERTVLLNRFRTQRAVYLVRYEKMWRECHVVPNMLNTYRLDI